MRCSAYEFPVETLRTQVESHGQAAGKFQSQDEATATAFVAAKGEMELAVDAGKVNTREEGWKDLKIAVISGENPGDQPHRTVANRSSTGSTVAGSVRHDRRVESVPTKLGSVSAPSRRYLHCHGPCFGRRSQLDLEFG